MDIQGTTRIAAPISPYNTDNTYATHEAQYGKGGRRTVANITERNAIPQNRREEGMHVWVSQEDKTYILKGGILDQNWEEDADGVSFELQSGSIPYYDGTKLTDTGLTFISESNIQSSGDLTIGTNQSSITIGDRTVNISGQTFVNSKEIITNGSGSRFLSDSGIYRSIDLSNLVINGTNPSDVNITATGVTTLGTGLDNNIYLNGSGITLLTNSGDINLSTNQSNGKKAFYNGNEILTVQNEIPDLMLLRWDASNNSIQSTGIEYYYEGADLQHRFSVQGEDTIEFISNSGYISLYTKFLSLGGSYNESIDIGSDTTQRISIGNSNTQLAILGHEHNLNGDGNMYWANDGTFKAIDIPSGNYVINGSNPSAVNINAVTGLSLQIGPNDQMYMNGSGITLVSSSGDINLNPDGQDKRVLYSGSEVLTVNTGVLNGVNSGAVNITATGAPISLTGTSINLNGVSSSEFLRMDYQYDHQVALNGTSVQITVTESNLNLNTGSGEVLINGNRIIQNGDGTLFLADDGEYKPMSGDTITVSQSAGQSTTDVMSQNAVTSALQLKLEPTNIIAGDNISLTTAGNNITINSAGSATGVTVVQDSGNSTTSVMSQNAVTEALGNKINNTGEGFDAIIQYTSTMISGDLNVSGNTFSAIGQNSIINSSSNSTISGQTVNVIAGSSANVNAQRINVGGETDRVFIKTKEIITTGSGNSLLTDDGSYKQLTSVIPYVNEYTVDEATTVGIYNYEYSGGSANTTNYLLIVSTVSGSGNTTYSQTRILGNTIEARSRTNDGAWSEWAELVM